MDYDDFNFAGSQLDTPGRETCSTAASSVAALASARGSPRPLLVPRLNPRGPSRSISKPPRPMPVRSVPCPSDVHEARAWSKHSPEHFGDAQEASFESAKCHAHFDARPVAELEPPAYAAQAMDARLGQHLCAMEAQLAKMHRAFDARLDECTSQWRACADLLNALDMKLAVHDPLGGVGASDFQEAMSRLLATQVPQASAAETMAVRISTTVAGEGDMRPSVTRRVRKSSKTPATSAVATIEHLDSGLDPLSGQLEEASSTPSSESAKQQMSGNPSGTMVQRMHSSARQSIVDIVGEGGDTSCLSRFVDKKWFNIASIAMTLVYAILVGIDTELETTRALREAMGDTPVGADSTVSSAFEVSQRVFLAFLMMEVVLRLLAGRASFFFGPDRYWNLFDVIILLASFINILGNGMSFGHVRLLRVTRLTRLARSVQAVRLFRGCDGLRKLMARCLPVLGAMCSVGCYLFLLMYIAGVVMMDGVTSFLDRDRAALAQIASADLQLYGGLNFLQALDALYGGLGRTWVTLALAVSGGDVFEAIAPLGMMSPTWKLVWIVYLACAVFGLLNILTATVVNIFRRPMSHDIASELDAELGEEKKLAGILSKEIKKMGKDEGEDITRHVFEQVISCPAVADQLSHAGVNISREEGIYHLVDPDGRGGVSAEEAARRLMALRGGAKAVDLMRIAREVGKVRGDLLRLTSKTSETLSVVRELIAEDGGVQTI